MCTGGLRHLMVRFGFDRVDEIRKLHRVLDEEHRHVVAHQIPVAFVGIELHRETARVARSVLGSALACDGREANEDGRDLAGLLERRGLGQVGGSVVALEETMCRRAAGMHDALGNALVVEVGELLAQDEVFQQRRPAHALLQ